MQRRREWRRKYRCSEGPLLVSRREPQCCEVRSTLRAAGVAALGDVAGLAGVLVMSSVLVTRPGSSAARVRERRQSEAIA